MIGYLSGKLMENQEGKALVAVGPTGSAVGYQVTLPGSSLYFGLVSGSAIELYVYTHVREDQLDLYGFFTKVEKEIFLTLLTVNGIGPKGAMGILTKVEIPTLVHAILNEDKESLTSIPGIGKKTAERVVIELADPLRKKMEQGLLPTEWKLNVASPSNSDRKLMSGGILFSSALFLDAKSALLGLGYRENEAVSALKKVQEGKPQPSKAEDVVKLALKELN